MRLGVECAEALAEMWHKRMRELQSAQSERRVYSFAMGSRVLPVRAAPSGCARSVRFDQQEQVGQKQPINWRLRVLVRQLIPLRFRCPINRLKRSLLSEAVGSIGGRLRCSEAALSVRRLM